MLACSKLSSAPCTQKQCQSGALLNVPCRQYSRIIRNTSAFIRRAAVAADTEEVTAVVHPVYPRLPAPEAAHFEADNTIFVEEFRIRGNEAGPDQRANIITIANLLQEVGGNHGVAMWGRSSTGFASMPGMDHLIFVATRMQIRMEAYPMWGDIVRLETYFAEDGRLTTRRDWRLTDAKTGRYLGAATSTWVTINTETRRPAKIPEDVKQRFRQLAPSPPRFAIAKDEARKKLPDFVWPSQLTAPSQLGRRSDMDPNGHINNVAYLAWALEVIPDNVCHDHQLKEVEMDFKAECTAGDEIDCFGMSLTAEGDTSKQQFLHLLRKGSTETEVWRARTTWVPVNSSGDFCSSSSSSSGSSTVANGVTLAITASNGVANSGGAAANSAAVPRNGTAAAASAAGAPASSSNSSLPSSSSSSDHSAAGAGSNGTAAAAAAPANGSSSTVGGGGLLGALAGFFGKAAANKSDI